MRLPVLQPLRRLLLLTLSFLAIQSSYAYLSNVLIDKFLHDEPTNDRRSTISRYSKLKKVVKQRTAGADPIRFTIQNSMQQVVVGEEFELTIKAQLMNVSPNLMFFLLGSNAYTLKMLLPTGFQQTGGTLTEFVTGELAQPNKSEATYTIRGFFTSATQNACFRLLRSHGQATNQSLFVEKATLCVPVYSVAKQGAARTATLNWCVEAETGSGNRSIESNSQASGGQSVGGFGNSGEYMSYTITNVPAADNYTLHLWYTSGETPQFGVVINGNLQTASGSSNGSWTGPFVEKTLTVSLQAGNNSLRIQGAGGSFGLDRLCVDGGSVCTPPSLILGTPTCNGTSTYSVGFTAQAGASVTSSVGSVQGSQVVNIPVGTNVTLTASLTGCSAQQTANSPSCSSGSLVSGNCYLITNQQTTSGHNTLQAIGNQALLQSVNGQADQIWKAESVGSQYRFTSQAGNRDQGLYVDGLSNGQPLKLGPYVANERYQWSLAASGQGGYRVYGGSNQNTWDQQGAGSSDGLQLYGSNADSSDPSWNQPYRRFSFSSVGCPGSTTVCTPPTLSLATPACNGTSTYSVGFTAQAGASVSSSVGSVQGSQVVNIPVGTNVTVTASLNSCSAQQSATSPTCNTTTSYNRVFIMGNSITHHPGVSDWQNGQAHWGMAASAPEKDYLHILTGYLQTLNSGIQVREFASFAPFGPPATGGIALDLIDGPRWESDYGPSLDNNPVFPGGINRYNQVADWQPNLLIMRVAENVDPSGVQSRNFPFYYKQVIDKFISQNPTCTVILTTSCWDQAATTAAITAVGAERGYTVVNLEGIAGARSGYGAHPNDAAMQVIADRIWSAIPKGTTPPPTPGGYDYPTPPTPASWPAYNTDILSGQQIGEVARLESPTVIVESRKRYGGAIQVIDKASGKKLIDFHDWGREAELTYYGWPANFSQGTSYPNIGWDPITVGDINNNGSPVVNQGFVTGNDGVLRWYVKTHLYSWPHNLLLTDCYNERWYGLTGSEVSVLTRTTFTRSDQTLYSARQQEYPCFMRPGNATMYYYVGNNPYTNDPVVQTSNLENNGQPFDQTPFNISEPWVATENGGVFFGMNTERMGRLTTTKYYPGGNDESEGANQTTYCTSNNTLTIDPNGVWYHTYRFLVASNLQTIRDWANSKPRKYGDVPNFTFDVAHGRNDWQVGNGTDQREPFTSDGWNATFVPSHDEGAPVSADNPNTARRSGLNSPIGIWKASLCPTLYVKLKYNGQENALRIDFKRNAQVDYDVDSNKSNQNAARFPNGKQMAPQSFAFTPIKDGAYHTYSFNAAANPEWKNVIQSFLVTYGPGNPVIPQEQIQMQYLGCVNPN